MATENSNTPDFVPVPKYRYEQTKFLAEEIATSANLVREALPDLRELDGRSAPLICNLLAENIIKMGWMADKLHGVLDGTDHGNCIGDDVDWFIGGNFKYYKEQEVQS